VFLTEVGGPVAKVVRTVVEAMTALPDILAGLFILSVLTVVLHWQLDGLSVSLALAVTMTPIVARSAEVVLRVVPGGLREAGMALGASNWQTVRRVVLPTARSGLATSLILGIARVTGETAPLLILSAPTTFWNTNPLKNSMSSLPLFIYTEIRSGETRSIQRGYGAASVLLALVLALFVAARLVARDKQSRTPRRPRPKLVPRGPGGGPSLGGPSPESLTFGDPSAHETTTFPPITAEPSHSMDPPIPPPPPARPSRGLGGYMSSDLQGTS
jgi:phosphate transport system permease protein